MADNSKKRDSDLIIVEKNKKILLQEEFRSSRNKIRKYKYVCIFGVEKMAEGWGYEFVRK